MLHLLVRLLVRLPRAAVHETSPLLQRSCEVYRRRQEEGRWDPSAEAGRFKDNRDFSVGVMGLGEHRWGRVDDGPRSLHEGG